MILFIIIGVVLLVVSYFTILKVYNNCVKPGYRLQVIQLAFVITALGLLVGYIIGVYAGQHDLLVRKTAHYKPVITSKQVTTPIGYRTIVSDTTYTPTLDRLPILYPQSMGKFSPILFNGDTLSVQSQLIYF